MRTEINGVCSQILQRQQSREQQLCFMVSVAAGVTQQHFVITCPVILQKQGGTWGISCLCSQHSAFLSSWHARRVHDAYVTECCFAGRCHK